MIITLQRSTTHLSVVIQPVLDAVYIKEIEGVFNRPAQVCHARSDKVVEFLAEERGRRCVACHVPPTNLGKERGLEGS